MANSILTDRESDVLANFVPEDVKQRLITQARTRFGNGIKPIRGAKRIDGGFRIYDDYYTFWYNGPDGSSHMIKEQKETINL